MQQLCLHPASCILDADPDLLAWLPKDSLSTAGLMGQHWSAHNLYCFLWAVVVSVLTQTACFPYSSLILTLPECQQGVSDVLHGCSPPGKPKKIRARVPAVCTGRDAIKCQLKSWNIVSAVCREGTIGVVIKTKPSPSCLSCSVRIHLGGTDPRKQPTIMQHLL